MIKKFDNFVNESSDSRILKAEPLLTYLKNITNEGASIKINDSDLTITGMFKTPFWWEKDLKVALEESNTATDILNKLNHLKDIFNANIIVGSDGSNYTKYTMNIDFKTFDKEINSSNFLKSISVINKFKL